MPINKNAFIRYKILDKCFSDKYHKYFIEDLMEKVNIQLTHIAAVFDEKLKDS